MLGQQNYYDTRPQEFLLAMPDELQTFIERNGGVSRTSRLKKKGITFERSPTRASLAQLIHVAILALFHSFNKVVHLQRKSATIASLLKFQYYPTC